MEYLAANNDLYNLLSNEESLISGEVKRINICYLEFTDIEKPYGIQIELDIKLLYSKKYKVVRIVFERVSAYCFFTDNSRDVYYIEEMKFFKTEDKWYISLDPRDQYSLKVDTNDNDFILAESIKGYILPC